MKTRMLGRFLMAAALLAGIVNTGMEKQIAGMRAASGLSFGPVTNNLVVEHPAKKS
jgi:hypothetical protein